MALANAISVSQTLTYLALSANSLDDNIIGVIATGLFENHVLRDLRYVI